MTGRPLQRQFFLSLAHDQGPTLRVAFASSDGAHVDQHFGSAQSFIVYSVGKSTANPIQIGEFSTTVSEGEGSKLSAKLSWLEQCDLLYAIAVGAQAKTQLMARGVLPLRVSTGSSIQALVEHLQGGLGDDAEGWVDQITRLRHQISQSMNSEPTAWRQED